MRECAGEGWGELRWRRRRKGISRYVRRTNNEEHEWWWVGEAFHRQRTRTLYRTEQFDTVPVCSEREYVTGSSTRS